jgi:ABC-2 type transport system permease protein
MTTRSIDLTKEGLTLAEKQARMDELLAVLAGNQESITSLPVRRVFDWEATLGIWKRDLLKFWRERTRLLGGVARPVLWLLILGSSLRPAIQRTGLGADYTHYIFAGVIALTLVFSTFQSAVSVIWDREFGFLKEVLAAPVPRSAVLLGKALGGATQATMQGIITLLFGPIIGLWLSPATLLELLVAMFFISFALSCMGLAISSSMTSFEGFGTISNFVVMPMYFLSGAIYPTTGLPTWLQALIVVNPLSYGVDMMRIIILGNGFGQFGIPVDALVLGLIAVVTLSVGVWQFNQE